MDRTQECFQERDLRLKARTETTRVKGNLQAALEEYQRNLSAAATDKKRIQEEFNALKEALNAKDKLGQQEKEKEKETGKKNWKRNQSWAEQRLARLLEARGTSGLEALTTSELLGAIDSIAAYDATTTANYWGDNNLRERQGWLLARLGELAKRIELATGIDQHAWTPNAPH